MHCISNAEGQVLGLLPQDAPGDSMRGDMEKPELPHPSDSLLCLSYCSGVPPLAPPLLRGCTACFQQDLLGLGLRSHETLARTLVTPGASGQLV